MLFFSLNDKVAPFISPLQKVQTNFLISGWEKKDPQRHTVMIVPHDRLEKAKEAFLSITSLHVYSVGLVNSDSKIGLHNVDYDQSEKYFSSSLEAGRSNRIFDNHLSAIREGTSEPKQASASQPPSSFKSQTVQNATKSQKNQKSSKPEEPKPSVPEGPDLREQGQAVGTLPPTLSHPQSNDNKASPAGELEISKTKVRAKVNQLSPQSDALSKHDKQTFDKKRKVMQTYINDAGEEVTGTTRQIHFGEIYHLYRSNNDVH